VSTKKTGLGPGPIVPPQTQGAQKTEAPKQVQAPVGRGIENLKQELPKSGLKGTSSPLAGLIASGLEALAKAEGWEGQQSALGVLVNAMMKANPKAETQQHIGRVDFESMLKKLAPADEEAAEVKEDAEKLAALAALIVNPDQGRKKQKNKRQQQDEDDEDPPDEMQLKRDVEEVRDALKTVLSDPSETREQHVTSLIDNLGWVANQLGKVDWQNSSVVRIDGFVGMMKVVVKYVRKGRNEVA
jgi:hypothetical protein